MRQRDSLIEHMANTGKLKDVGMEKEDLGQIVFIF